MNNPAVCLPRDLQLQAAMFRLSNVDEQIRAGYEVLRKYHKTVTVFGSARTPETSEYYQKARELGERLAKEGYTVVTGGGPGIMEAANRGAFEAGGASIGFNIELPHEQSLNNYTTESSAFSHFAPRKIALTMMAHAYIYFPGGFGTMDELSEILTLMQTGKMRRAPIILFDRKFWGAWHHFVADNMLCCEHLISPGDETIYTITEDLDEVMATVRINRTYCDA